MSRAFQTPKAPPRQRDIAAAKRRSKVTLRGAEGQTNSSISMQVMSGDSFQIHFHPKLGPVIYDPVAQMGLAREQMRLFKLGSMSASTFLRNIVSKDLGACSEAQLAEHAGAVEAYRAARSGRRKPYCEQCRRHYGSVDFTVCGDCHSIRCTCGTCSCASSSRRRRAA